MNSDEEEDSVSHSPANSITSVNSLASLFREKLQSIPQTLRKPRSPDYKIRIFVGFLFIAIVVLISYAYFQYHQKVLHKAYFEAVKLNNANKVMKIYSFDGTELVHVRLGTTINAEEVYPCLPKHRVPDSICLEWLFKARLYLSFQKKQEEINCYNFKWISLRDNLEPTDCFDLNPINGHWYGGGQSAESAWPLEKGKHGFAPFITGRVDKHQWGNVLKRHFISSKGAAILVDKETPLYVSITGQESKELCLKAKYDNFAFVNKISSNPQLNYSICTGHNMSNVHHYIIKNTLWDGLKKEDFEFINSLIAEPLWEISTTKDQINDETIQDFANKIIEIGYMKQGHVLINEFWQKHVGDFEMDNKRFPDVDKTITMLLRRGFRIVLSIQPFISTESFNFAEAVKKRLLIFERYSHHKIPALTRYKTLESAGVLDITNNKTIPWLVKKLKKALNKYKINAYFLDFGTAYNMPHYYQCSKPLVNPDEYKTIFINSLQGAVNLFATNSAVETHSRPSFVSLPQSESSWDGLKRIIPTVLTYGILGYPFLIPGAVGGDYTVPEVPRNDSVLPEEELYIRWLQLSTFLPVVRYNNLLSSYKNTSVLEMAKTLALFRQNKVLPLLKKYTRIALNEGLPIIRPLWMLDENDPSSHIIADEFSIGEDMIVAPILSPRAREREVYLPSGIWKDGIDGSVRKGGRWIHDYRVAEDKIAFFEKMPDDTRF